MKKNVLIIFFISFALISCQKDEIKNISFDDDFVAKKLVGVQCDFPENSVNVEYNWYIGPSPDGDWEKLSGIWSDKIILLTSYVGKYLKCEVNCTILNSDEKVTASVISSKPVEYNGNSNTDWLKDAGYGIMVHYLKEAIVPEGGFKEWNEAVDSFKAERFASQVNEAGAGFVMFTLGQNSGYYCSPNAAFDSIVGTKPGELCTIRDLPMDLITALGKYNIPVILYLPSNPPISNKLVSEKFKYAFKKDSATSQYNQPILENMIREWSLRYGTGVKGWWFDGLYQWNNIRDTRMDMSLRHNISTHTLAARAGNRNSIVSYNSGFGEIKANTPYCDYSSGEKSTIDEFPTNRWVEDGVQWFLFTYLGEKWGGKGQQFETDKLVEMATKIVENEGVLCLEVVTNTEGEILPHHLEQIKQVGKSIGKTR
ncbi:MAG TPA: alpha-L-fucosidase [Draconibacterium sp.]|nr:alpha-L-fucosidase [Draconibacterium sp.]